MFRNLKKFVVNDPDLAIAVSVGIIGGLVVFGVRQSRDVFELNAMLTKLAKTGELTMRNSTTGEVVFATAVKV